MTLIRIAALLAGASLLTACEVALHPEVGPDKSRDLGSDAHPLNDLVAGIWIDPNGCHHWIIDDGVEGYLSERLQPDGRPVCGGYTPETIATDPFQDGTEVPDPL